jgi:hypothetical protein
MNVATSVRSAAWSGRRIIAFSSVDFTIEEANLPVSKLGREADDGNGTYRS